MVAAHHSPTTTYFVLRSVVRWSDGRRKDVMKKSAYPVGGTSRKILKGVFNLALCRCFSYTNRDFSDL
jgi:hypothetical protein